MSGSNIEAKENKVSEISTPLAAAIEQEIAEKGPMRFDQYMEAWNHGIHNHERQISGYYSGSNIRIGQMEYEKPHFITTPERTPIFGYLLGLQALKVWEATGRDQSFKIIEMGAGNGVMARDIMEGIRYFGKQMNVSMPISYVIVEKSPTLRAIQEEQLESYPVKFMQDSAQEVKLDPFVGVVFTNELPDDFPVRKYRKNSRGEWEECFIDIGSKDAFSEIWQRADTQVIRDLDKIDAQPSPDGNYYYNESAVSWMRNLALSLQSGAIYTIDYPQELTPLVIFGELGDQAISPEKPYLQKSLVGGSCMTVGVDFNLIENAGIDNGLETHLKGTQEEFMFSAGFAGLRDELRIYYNNQIPPNDYRRKRMRYDSEIAIRNYAYKALLQTKKIDLR